VSRGSGGAGRGVTESVINHSDVKDNGEDGAPELTPS